MGVEALGGQDVSAGTSPGPGRRPVHPGTDAPSLVEIIRVDRTARPVTSEVIRTYENEGPGSNVSPQPRETQEQVLASRMYADSLPHFQVVQPAPDGSLWLGEFTGHVGGTPTRWWRISADAGLEGHLDLPEGFRVLSFEEGEVLGVERDELDVPFGVGYRVRWPRSYVRIMHPRRLRRQQPCAEPGNPRVGPIHG